MIEHSQAVTKLERKGLLLCGGYYIPPIWVLAVRRSTCCALVVASNRDEKRQKVMKKCRQLMEMYDAGACVESSDKSRIRGAYKNAIEQWNEPLE